MKANVLAEEYYGFGEYEKSGGWLQHYSRWMMFIIRIHLPFKKEDQKPGEDGFLPPTPKDTITSPQEQERLAQLELERDEAAMKAAQENADQ